MSFQVGDIIEVVGHKECSSPALDRYIGGKAVVESVSPHIIETMPLEGESERINGRPSTGWSFYTKQWKLKVIDSPPDRILELFS